MFTRSLFVILACAIGRQAAAASAWVKSELPTALRFLFLQCDSREFGFAIACPDKKLQLVNFAPGGGPFGNPDFEAKG